jgi:broad specificity phosphatase PhoE
VTVVVGVVVAALLCVLVIVWWWWFRCGPATTLLIVRHADRVEGVDALTPAGIVRSQELVHVAEKSGLVAIYRSDTERALATAEPLATALGVTPVVYPATDIAGLVATIFSQNTGRTVLIVGHGNTVPQIITAVGGPTLPDIDALEFDNLFVVSICQCWRRSARVANLQYGAPSP